jgi:hypothetical protein
LIWKEEKHERFLYFFPVISANGFVFHWLPDQIPKGVLADIRLQHHASGKEKEC